MKYLIFVYGNMKQGFNRHNVLVDQRYLGIAKTEPKYAMYIYGGQPALITEETAAISELEAKSSIYGELYEIDGDCLKSLDAVETTSGLFERRNVELTELVICNLPVTEAVWENINNKKAMSFFFKKTVAPSKCGDCWLQK